MSVKTTVIALAAAMTPLAGMAANESDSWKFINPESKTDSYWNAVDLRPTADTVQLMTNCYAYRNDGEKSQVDTGRLTVELKGENDYEISLIIPSVLGLSKENHPAGFAGFIQTKGEVERFGLYGVKRYLEVSKRYSGFHIIPFQQENDSEVQRIGKEDMIQALQKGRELEFVGITKDKQQINLKCSLMGFTKAYQVATK